MQTCYYGVNYFGSDGDSEDDAAVVDDYLPFSLKDIIFI